VIHEHAYDVTRADAVRATRVIRGLKYEIDESELPDAKQPLKLGRVNHVTFERIKQDAAVNVIAELMSVLEQQGDVNVGTAWLAGSRCAGGICEEPGLRRCGAHVV
jgi:hypothetical protein